MTGYWLYGNLISNKIKLEFLQAVDVNLLYSCTTWTLNYVRCHSGDLESVEYLFIAITLRSTQTQISSSFFWVK